MPNYHCWLQFKNIADQVQNIEIKPKYILKTTPQKNQTSAKLRYQGQTNWLQTQSKNRRPSPKTLQTIRKIRMLIANPKYLRTSLCACNKNDINQSKTTFILLLTATLKYKQGSFRSLPLTIDSCSDVEDNNRITRQNFNYIQL